MCVLYDNVIIIPFCRNKYFKGVLNCKAALYDNVLRAVPGKTVLGGGTELENGGTTNTIFFMVQSKWIFQETPPPT